jgi:mannitol-1-/sugar-/sorbitol-6-phosphatase
LGALAPGTLRPVTARAVLFDVDGTLLDVVSNQRRVWHMWADRYGLDHTEVYACATRTIPPETFAIVAPHLDSAECLAALHELEDNDARLGIYRAFAGADDLLRGLPRDRWAVVTSNYAHRVAIRFARLGLPDPPVVIDAAAVTRGKPDPEGYLQAADRLRMSPDQCLVCEDSNAGVRAGLDAGMTVWTVNVDANNTAAHRHYPTLDDAAGDIRRWVNSN